MKMYGIFLVVVGSIIIALGIIAIFSKTKPKRIEEKETSFVESPNIYGKYTESDFNKLMYISKEMGELADKNNALFNTASDKFNNGDIYGWRADIKIWKQKIKEWENLREQRKKLLK